MKKTMLILLFIIMFSNLFGQKKMWDIQTVQGLTHKNVYLHAIKGDSLFMTAYGLEFGMPINDIVVITHEKKGHVFFASLSGTLLGAGIGLAIARSDINNAHGMDVLFSPFVIIMDMVAYSFGGMLGGTAVGLIMDKDEIFNFSKMTLTEKKRKLLLLLNGVTLEKDTSAILIDDMEDD